MRFFKLLQQLREVLVLTGLPSCYRASCRPDVRSAHAMHRLTHDIDVLDEFMLRVVSPGTSEDCGTDDCGVYRVVVTFGIGMALWLGGANVGKSNRAVDCRVTRD